MLRPEN